MSKDRYPKLLIRSKNELAKRLTRSEFSFDSAMALISDVTHNKEKYWRDTKKFSVPEKGKFVRSAKGTKLDVFLKKIDTQILAPHDSRLPLFIYGGKKGSGHILAAYNLLGDKKRRTFLKLDLSRFFEQISQERVQQFFQIKCGCSKKLSKFLAEMCCVALGAKGSLSSRRTLARGFSTSTRLAVWCNLDAFIKVHRLVLRELRGKDPRLSIFIDDIGITASGLTKHRMAAVSKMICALLRDADKNQPLIVNEEKTGVTDYRGYMEIYGLRLMRNGLLLGKKTLAKKGRLKKILDGHGASGQHLQKMKRSLKGIRQYEKNIRRSRP